jgi:hypothetical protein
MSKRMVAGNVVTAGEKSTGDTAFAASGYINNNAFVASSAKIKKADLSSAYELRDTISGSQIVHTLEKTLQGRLSFGGKGNGGLRSER